MAYRESISDRGEFEEYFHWFWERNRTDEKGDGAKKASDKYGAAKAIKNDGSTDKDFTNKHMQSAKHYLSYMGSRGYQQTVV